MTRASQRRVLSIAYLAFVLLLTIVSRFIGENHWVPIVLLYMPQVLVLVPAVLLLLLSVLTRSKVETAVNLFSILIVALLLMQFRVSLLTKTPGVTPSDHRLRVLTYNIHGGTFGASKVIEALRQSAAEVIFLQEARKPARRKCADPIPILVAAFPDWYSVRGGELLILSRFPLSGKEERALGFYRTCLICQMEHGTHRVRLINVHFSTSAKGRSLNRSGGHFREYLVHTALVRREQTQALERLLREGAEPVIVAGDFNSPPNAYPHKVLTGPLVDCFDRAGRGCGFTYPASIGLWRIDHIYASGDLRVDQCGVLNARASDHLPVVADLILHD